MEQKQSAFQTPITINDAIDEIHKKKYLLPAIQREFVWDPEKIIKLFDSLMNSYAIFMKEITSTIQEQMLSVEIILR